MDTIITILGSITETSMPFNEFVIYKANHYKNENQLVIVCGSEKKMPEIDIPSNVEIQYVGKNIFKIRKKLKQIIKDLERDNKKYIFHLHQLHSAFLTQVAMLGTKFQKKSLYTIHSTFTGYSFYNKILCFITSLFSKKIVCVSQSSYDNFPIILKKIKKQRVLVIQNGVDTERIDLVLKSHCKKNNKCVKFSYAARLIPLKNHTFLIDVLKKTNSNVKFVFIGEGNKKSELEKICSECNLNEKVEFTGLLPRNEVYKKIQETDVYISSSTLEGMPVSVLEAGYIGLPLILSNIKQHVELANEEKSIKLLPFEIDKWVSTINKYANMTYEERVKIGMDCKNYILNNFSLQKMHASYEKQYISLN